MGERRAKKVLLVGWDAADWNMINPMLARGLMPTLQRFLSEGVRGNLTTLHPMLSPMLWTSIVTGKRADRHGIHGFIEPRADGGGVECVTSTSRTTRALWNQLHLSGLTSNIVGFFATDPAEPIRGVMVSDAALRTGKLGGNMPAFPPASVSPRRLAERVAELRVSPEEMTGGHVGPFVPTLGEVPEAESGPLSAIAQILAHTSTTHNVFTDLLEHEPWDFAAVYYSAIDHFGHGFMQYHPPRMAHIPPRLFERYRGVMEGCYRLHDMMLERLLQLAGEETTVMIVSDHGFLSDHRRPLDGGTAAGAEGWHREQGIIALRGPGMRRGGEIHGASLLDVTPTILALFGLPLGRDMEGRALVNAFEKAPALERIDSWDSLPGDAGAHPADLQVDPFEQQAAIEQLVELGYLASPGDDQTRAIALARHEARCNLGVVHIEAGRPERAVEVLAALCAEVPEEARYLTLLARAYMLAGRTAECRATIDAIRALPSTGTGPGAGTGAGTGTGAGGGGGTGGDPVPLLEMLLAVSDFSEGKHDAAIAHLQAAERAAHGHPTLPIQLGNLYLRRRRWADAERLFRKALTIDAESPHGHYGLGCAQLHQGDLPAAADSTLRAVEMMHHFPRAHLQLGIVLTRLGRYDGAEKAFRTGLTQRPGMVAAHRFLSRLYLRLGRADLAKYHGDLARDLMRRARPMADGAAGIGSVGPFPVAPDIGNPAGG